MSALKNLAGTVITNFGNEILIQDDHGNRLRAFVRQNIATLVTGDRVLWDQDDQGQAVIHTLQPRSGTLIRHLQHKGEKIVASNIDQVLIVCSHKPAFKTGLIDRYLIACELSDINACLIFNKIDAVKTEKFEKIKLQLAIYESIGYPVLYVSAKQHEHIEALEKQIANDTVAMVGQSGVGKSSLIKALIPGSDPRIGKISTSTNKGKHTTTHTELYTLPKQGHIIDSPGIREFAPLISEQESLAKGFREFSKFLGDCQFRDCHHDHEPGCKIREAVEQGQIHQQRYESYLKLLEDLNSDK